MKINARWFGDVVRSVETINRMFPKSMRAATNASKRTKEFLDRFDSSSTDDRLDVIRAVCSLAWFCDELTRDVGTIEIRVEQSGGTKES